MSLPEVSIKRHVFAFMLNAVLVLFGIIAYQRIGIDKLPFIEFPVVSVTTAMKGANPDIVDSSITNVVETSVNSVPGIEDIQSSSSPGVSVITLTFNLEKRIDVAFNEVQAKVNQVLRRLPKEADPPVVAKVETNASPIFWMALQGDRTQQQLNQYAINILKKKLETIDGVGEVRVGGRRDRTIRVDLNVARMAAFGVSAQDVQEAFNREHIQAAGGFVVGTTTESLVKLDLEFHRIDDLEKLIVRFVDGAPVRLKDIATVEDGLADYRQLARFNQKPAIGLGLVKIPSTNTVAIIETALKRMNEELIPALPPGMTLTVVSNDALFINEMVKSLKEHLVEGTLLAAFIVFLFLLSFRSTIIIALAIPVSLMGAIAVMYFFGYTFNSVTLLALLLLIGVVVDDAIVVLENIFRHREELDPDPMSAAVNGSNEVAFAVLAASLSLVCIFAPVIFLGGIVGQFFRSFAVVVTFGVLVSLFVSLTLTPMLCSRFLVVSHGKGEKENFVYRFIRRCFVLMDKLYRYALEFALKARWIVVLIAAAVSGSSVYFFREVPKTLAPDQDEGRFIVRLRSPLGSSIEYTSDKLKQVEVLVAKHPELVSEFAVIGLGTAGQVNQGQVVIRMTARSERKRSQSEVIAALRKEVQQVAGARVFVSPFGIVQGQRPDPLQFVITGPNLQEVGRIGREVQRLTLQDPDIGRLDTDLQLDLPQMTILPDRTRAAGLGLTSADISLALNMLTGGIDIAKYNDDAADGGDGQRYDVRIKAREGDFQGPADLSKIFLRNRQGQLIRLDAVVQPKELLGPAVVARYNLQFSSTFYGTPTIPLGPAVEKIRTMTQGLMPPGYELQFIGNAKELGRTTSAAAFAFGLALLLLYMVLASQFNSFIQPFIIMVAVPLAIIGGVFALWLSQPISQLSQALFGAPTIIHSLNIYSMIGLVLLIGLVAKNSILLVDLTNQRRAEGMGVDEALRNACPVRMRPVLMTSLTIILALLPAALGFGAGNETNGPLAVAVIGGMISSTLLTLVVVPSVYSLVENGMNKLPKRWANRAPAAVPAAAPAAAHGGE